MVYRPIYLFLELPEPVPILLSARLCATRIKFNEPIGNIGGAIAPFGRQHSEPSRSASVSSNTKMGRWFLRYSFSNSSWDGSDRPLCRQSSLFRCDASC
jgi:hypothetical protein